MQFPFVARARLVDAQQQIAELKAERAMLLDRLLNPPVKEVPKESPKEPIALAPSNSSPVPYTTPFDSLGAKFDRAKNKGALSPQFRARAF